MAKFKKEQLVKLRYYCTVIIILLLLYINSYSSCIDVRIPINENDHLLWYLNNYNLGAFWNIKHSNLKVYFTKKSFFFHFSDQQAIFHGITLKIVSMRGLIWIHLSKEYKTLKHAVIQQLPVEKKILNISFVAEKQHTYVCAHMHKNKHVNARAKESTEKSFIIISSLVSNTHKTPHVKTNKMTVRPAKTQISLGIRPFWSESSLSAWRNLGSLATHWAHSEDSDQTGRMPRLTWVFAGRTLILLLCHVAAHIDTQIHGYNIEKLPGKLS